MNECNKLFYEGTYYSSEQEFIDGVVNFNKRTIDETSIDSLLAHLTACIKINLMVHEPKPTNSKLKYKLMKVLNYAIKEIFTVEN
jgi:hypothetical protein